MPLLNLNVKYGKPIITIGLSKCKEILKEFVMDGHYYIMEQTNLDPKNNGYIIILNIYAEIYKIDVSGNGLRFVYKTRYIDLGFNIPPLYLDLIDKMN